MKQSCDIQGDLIFSFAKSSYNGIASSKICSYQSTSLTLRNNILSYTIKGKKLISDSLWVQIFESSGFCHICSLTAVKTVFWYHAVSLHHGVLRNRRYSGGKLSPCTYANTNVQWKGRSQLCMLYLVPSQCPDR